jgi:hypothetical protein
MHSRGITAVGIFLFFGAVMASLAGLTLVRPGTLLDRIWVLNQNAHTRLAPWGPSVGVLFLILATTLTASGIGWFRRKTWGWQLSVAIIGIQMLGDLVNALTGDLARGAIGFIVAAALLLYLRSSTVRNAFVHENKSRPDSNDYD